MKKEDDKTKKEENKYLFYTQYYLTAGVYHVVNVVNSILNYSATYSSGVKEYLEEKVLLQKTIIDDIVADANKKKFEFDEDDYVIIKMRKAAVVVQSVVPVPVPVPNKTFENNADNNNINGGIVDEIVNDIINNAVLSATVNTIVNDIINNAVDIVAARNSSCVPCVESLNHHDDDDGVPHHKSSIITSSYYAQFV
jgi:hypothetical protein